VGTTVGDKFWASARSDLVLDFFSDYFDFVHCGQLDGTFDGWYGALIMMQPNTVLEPKAGSS